MQEVHKVVSQAAARLLVGNLLRWFTVSLAAGLVAMLVARIGERVFGVEFPWTIIASSVGAGVLLVSVVGAALTRERGLAVARLLDERATLHEVLSTAMYVASKKDEWSQAVVQDARATAKTLRVGDAIEIETPKWWPVPIAAAVVLALVWVFFPKLDILKIDAARVAKQAKQQEVIAVKADLQSKQEELKQALKSAKVEFLDQKPDDDSKSDRNLDAKPDDNDPDSLRRDAVKKLTDLTEKLQAAKEGEKSAQVDAQKEAMRQLKQPGDGPVNEFSRALSRGDFNKAREHLKQLEQKLASGSLTPEEKAAASKQMENLGAQLKQMAENQTQVAKQLEKAGLDKKSAQALAKQAASNPEALKKAIDGMKNLSPEQKQQMLEMAKAAAKACENAGKMGEGMSKMAKGMTQDGMQQEGEQGSGELDQKLSEAETLGEDMQNLDAALDQAKKQLAELGDCLGGDCDKPGSGKGNGKSGGWKPGDSSKVGKGSGGSGQSQGGMSPQGEAADFEFKKEKAQVSTQGGPIIGSRLVYGEAVKGESSAEFEAVVIAGSRDAADAMESMQIPREYHDAVKHYFGRLQEKVKKDAAAAPANTLPPTPAVSKK